IRRAGSAVLALCLLILSTPAAASLSVQPAFVELDLSKGRPAKVVTVTNVSDQELRYRAETVHFVYTAGGSFETVEPDAQSMASWIKFNPREFTLAAGESRSIRLTVVAPKNLDDGEYWAALRFEPLVGLVSKSEVTDGKSVAIEVRTNILVPIVGRKGDLVFQCSLTDLKAWRSDQGFAVVASVANTGNGRARVVGTCEVLDADGNPVADGPLGEDTILAGGERRFERLLAGDYPPGAYTVRVRCTSKNFKDVLAGQTGVRDEPPAGYDSGTP
ncbi:DUF916 domain-containing protein, partial [bacterium]|nr:DUF916 domain-containing protein [bacterium]